MATTKSTSVTNYDATPQKMNDKHTFRSRRKVIREVIEVAAADDDGHIYAIAPVHSTDVIEDIMVMNDAIADGTDYDIGLYDTTANGAAVVDANAYADAVSMASARVARTSLGFEGGGRDIANAKNRVWQDAGASADTAKDYVLALTANTVGTVAGTIVVDVLILEGD